MIAYTDSVSYGGKILGDGIDWSSVLPEFRSTALSALVSRIYTAEEIAFAASAPGEFWRYLFAVEHARESQFDIVVDLCRQNVELPDGLLCSAGSGDLLHGQHDRPWLALPGNIHLTAHFAPNQSVAEIGVGFSLLAAVSMIETIDAIGDLQGRAGIKWVNDIVIENAKVAGYITHTASVDGIVTSAVVGIGLNVEATPPITPDRFFHRAACLTDLSGGMPGATRESYSVPCWKHWPAIMNSCGRDRRRGFSIPTAPDRVSSVRKWRFCPIRRIGPAMLPFAAS